MRRTTRVRSSSRWSSPLLSSTPIKAIHSAGMEDLMMRAQKRQSDPSSHGTALHVCLDPQWCGYHAVWNCHDDGGVPDFVKELVAAWPGACTCKNEQGCTPLHVALLSNGGGGASLELVQVLCGDRMALGGDVGGGGSRHFHDRSVVARRWMSKASTFESLPLHLAAKDGRWNSRVIRYLLQLYPEAASVEESSSRQLPFTLAITATQPRRTSEETLAILKLLYSANKNAATIPRITLGNAEDDNDTALHSAVAAGSSKTVLQYLLRLYPEAASHATFPGRNLPLHLCYSSPERLGDNADPLLSLESVQLLYNAYPSAATTRNMAFKTPLHLALQYSRYIQDVALGLPMGSQLEEHVLWLVHVCPSSVTQQTSYAAPGKEIGVPLQMAMEASAFGATVVRAMLRAAVSATTTASNVLAMWPLPTQQLLFLDDPRCLQLRQLRLAHQTDDDDEEEEQPPIAADVHQEKLLELLRFYPAPLYRDNSCSKASGMRAHDNQQEMENNEDHHDIGLLRQQGTTATRDKSLLCQFRESFGEKAFGRFLTLLYGEPFLMEGDPVGTATTNNVGERKQPLPLAPFSRSTHRLGWTPLHRAAHHSSFGRDVSLAISGLHQRCQSHIQQRDGWGRVPLHVAVEHASQSSSGYRNPGHAQVMVTLIQAWPDGMEVRDGVHGYTPLELALEVLRDHHPRSAATPSVTARHKTKKRGAKDAREIGKPEKRVFGRGDVASDLDAPFVLLRSMPSAVLQWCWS